MHLGDAVRVELQVVPGRCVPDHVPAYGIGAEPVQGLEGVRGVAEALAHLLAVLVQHEAIAHHRLVRHLVEYERGDGVQRVEPASGLVHAFGDEIGREFLLQIRLVLKGVMELGVRHRSAIEPDVDQVGLALHRLPAGRYQHDVVGIGAVQVHAVVVTVAHIRRVEGCIRIGGHYASGHRTCDLFLQLLQRADAELFGAILRAPYR